MKKSILQVGTKLNREEQKRINGGLCDIAPPGCPCIVPPGHPCLGGSGGGGGNTGVCIIFPFGPVPTPCDQLCPDGTQPICA